VALSFQNISLKQLARGLDLRAVENAVTPGYSERLRNITTSSSGHISKRKGYQTYAGSLPMRARTVTHTTNKITISLDGSINTLNLPKSPLVVFGKLGKPSAAATGDFTTSNTLRYYPTFTTTIPDSIAAGPQTSVFQAGRYNATYGNPLFSTAINTSPTDSSWSWAVYDWDVNNTAPYDIDVSTILPSLTDVFFYANDYQGVGGTSYATTYTGGNAAKAATVPLSSMTVAANTITATAHTLTTGDSVVFSLASSLPPELSAGVEYFVINASTNTFQLAATSGGPALSLTNGSYSATLDARGTTYTIFASQHQLNTFFILPQIFIEAGVEWQAVLAQELLVNESTGAVTVRILNSTASPLSVKVLLVSSSGNETATSTNPSTYTTTLNTPFVHIAMYDTVIANTKQFVYPDTATYNDVTKNLTFTYTGLSGTARFNWAYSSVQSNALVLEDTTDTFEAYVDNSPQITIWGLEHEGAYNTALFGGHVSHIDSYRNAQTTELVAGLGGNLYKALEFADAAVEYGYGNTEVEIQNRVASTVTLGPLFRTTGAPTSRGFGSPAVTANNIDANGYAVITDIVVTNVGEVTYTFNFSNKANNLDSTLLEAQELTVTNAPYDLFNGTFKIIGFNNTANTITVKNPDAVLTGIYDSSGLDARGAVFTDKLSLSGVQEFLAGDTLTWSDAGVSTRKVLATATDHVVLNGITTLLTLSGGLLVTGERHTSYVPVNDIKDIVTGDMCAVDGLLRQVRVRRVRAPQTLSIVSISCNNSGIATVEFNRPHNLLVNDKVLITETLAVYDGLRTVSAIVDPFKITFNTGTNTSQPTVNLVGRAHRTITSITGSGTTATVVTDARHYLNVGDQILVLGTTKYDGVHTVTSTPSFTTFTFASTVTTAYTASVTPGDTVAYLRGGFIIDETLNIYDDPDTPQKFTVANRWIPIEIPSTAFDLPTKAVVQHWTSKSYDNQKIIRSTTVSDNLYLTNQDDIVYKYDGTSLSQAGLPKWQAQLFTSFDTSIPALAEGPKYSYTAKDDDARSLTLASIAPIKVGDIIYLDGDNVNTFIVTDIDLTQNMIFLTGQEGATFTNVFTSSTGDIRRVRRYYYYFRLNAVDANNNLISSAVTGQEDYIVDLNVAATIKHRLVGLPSFSFLDYDRLELQVFRTKANVPGSYFLVQQLALNFDNTEGYIDVSDGLADEALITQDSLGLNTATVPPTINGLGTELGTTWTLPPRAAYVTSADNRLILANIKDYSNVSITLRKKNQSAEFTAADLSGKFLKFHKDILVPGTVADNVNDLTVAYTTATPTTITNITATTTSFTVLTATTPLVGNWVYLFHHTNAPNHNLTYAGWWQVASVVPGVSFTVNFNHAGATPTNFPVRFVTAANKALPVYLSADYNYKYFGAQDLDETDVQIRTANAINSAMRMVDVTLAGQSTFTPWLFAYAGSEYGLGTLIVRQETTFTSNFGLTTPAAIVSGEYYVNGVLRSPNTEISSTRRLFPSRVVISYPNFPEIFDNPYADQSESDSVIDVNSADGQEITGIIPFFGETVFGSGSVEDILVVFKTNSVYLVDIRTRQISKVSSRGLGCTAPYSIATTKDGIIFANESGIYRLNRNQSVSYVGQFIERYWQDVVNKVDMSRITGHHYAVGNAYKLSVPINDEANNSTVLVYDHQLEGREQEFGAWSEYTNHPVTGWANLRSDAFFASTLGRVFVLRNSGEASDYRDDAAAITSDVILRAMDFDQSGVRKVISTVTSHLQLRSSSQTGTQLFSSVDLNGDFEPCDVLTAEKTNNVKVVSLRSSLPRRKQIYLQLQYVNAVKDEEFILSGVDMYAALLNNKGVREAVD
jgi:hypothetical protein